MGNLPTMPVTVSTARSRLIPPHSAASCRHASHSGETASPATGVSVDASGVIVAIEGAGTSAGGNGGVTEEVGVANFAPFLAAALGTAERGCRGRDGWPVKEFSKNLSAWNACDAAHP